MNAYQARVSLNLIDIGSRRLEKLLQYFPSPEEIFHSTKENLLRIEGIGEEIAGKITNFKNAALEEELKFIKQHKLKVITLDDAAYPLLLKKIYDPPIVLYYKGELRQADNLSIAVVGSRRPSFYGLNAAESFAFQLAEVGVTVISGMARGIDTRAHQGALRAGGRTIAVMGSGFNYPYPPENQELAETIASCGAVISEFPCNIQPLARNFPRRNRLISGLSLGVLVVEAARNSGALITADFALEQGREVFSLPGKIDTPTASGTNGLIQQGAKLIRQVSDILDEFNLNLKRHPAKINREREIATKQLSREEQILYNLISRRAQRLDEIIESCNLPVNRVIHHLLHLQLKKLIGQQPGKQFFRIGN